MYNKIMIKKKFKYKSILPVIVIAGLALILCACDNQSYAEENDDPGISVEVSAEGWNETDATYITLNGNSADIEGAGATVSGGTVNIISQGTYIFSGSLSDGQVIVYTEDEGDVNLILDGADIASSDGAPLYVLSADKVLIYLEEGTQNQIAFNNSEDVTDLGSDVPDAAIFSKSDLTVKGEGSLTVTSAANHGIKCNDDLKISGCDITVVAALDGVRGKDSVEIKNADLTVEAGGDAIKSNNDEDEEKGYVKIDDANLDLTAGEDGIQAETILTVSGGVIDILCGGGSANGTSQASAGGGMFGAFNNNSDDSDTTSMKGIKAGSELVITDGEINIDSTDDSLHSNGTIVIEGGNFTLSTGDDGIHADTSIVINNGDITINQSYEGIESADITINGGNIAVVATDDGINVAGGMDGSPFNNGQFGSGDSFSTSDSGGLDINGGYISVDAQGDGVDIGGPVAMTDGVLIISGPSSDGNGALDYTSSFNISGGFLVAAGSSGMAQTPSSDSSQYSLSINFSSSLDAGTMVHIQSEDGEDILTFAPQRQYQSLVVSSPELEAGGVYSVYYGGSCDGSEENGLYSGGTYTPGTEYATIEITDIVTSYGSTSGGMGGGRGGNTGNGGNMDGSPGGTMPGGSRQDRSVTQP